MWKERTNQWGEIRGETERCPPPLSPLLIDAGALNAIKRRGTNDDVGWRDYLGGNAETLLPPVLSHDPTHSAAGGDPCTAAARARGVSPGPADP